MTVSTLGVRHEFLPGSGGIPEAIPFQFRDAGDLIVQRVTAGGVVTPLYRDVHYTLAGDGMAATGQITPTIALGADKMRVTRATDTRQEEPLPAHEPIPSDSVEDQLDRMSMLDQEHKRHLAEHDYRGVYARDGEAGFLLPEIARRQDQLTQFTFQGALDRVPPLPAEQSIVTLSPYGNPRPMTLRMITGGDAEGDDFDGGWDEIDGTGQNFDGEFDGAL